METKKIYKINERQFKFISEYIKDNVGMKEEGMEENDTPKFDSYNDNTFNSEPTKRYAVMVSFYVNAKNEELARIEAGKICRELDMKYDNKCSIADFKEMPFGSL
jgi:hypothetical protein